MILCNCKISCCNCSVPTGHLFYQQSPIVGVYKRTHTHTHTHRFIAIIAGIMGLVCWCTIPCTICTSPLLGRHLAAAGLVFSSLHYQCELKNHKPKISYEDNFPPVLTFYNTTIVKLIWCRSDVSNRLLPARLTLYGASSLHSWSLCLYMLCD